MRRDTLTDADLDLLVKLGEITWKQSLGCYIAGAAAADGQPGDPLAFSHAAWDCLTGIVGWSPRRLAVTPRVAAALEAEATIMDADPVIVVDFERDPIYDIDPSMRWR